MLSSAFQFSQRGIKGSGETGEGGLGTELMIEANNVCNLFHCTMISRHFFFGDCSTFFVLTIKFLLSELELEFDFDFVIVA